MQKVVETAAFLAIGNELLSGKVVEANLAPLAKTLRALGIQLSTAEILLDDVPTLASAIARLSAAYGVVVTSGGVGPTHDDVTIEAVAQAFKRRVVRDATLVDLVRIGVSWLVRTMRWAMGNESSGWHVARATRTWSR